MREFVFLLLERSQGFKVLRIYGNFTYLKSATAASSKFTPNADEYIPKTVGRKFSGTFRSASHPHPLLRILNGKEQ